MAGLSVRGLTKTYSTSIFADLSFDVPPGEILCLRGANGAGKSTVLQCLAGHTAADDGRVTWQGKQVDCGALHHVDKSLAILGEPLWIPGHTVLDHALLLTSGRRDPAEAALARLCLSSLADQSPWSLSSGQFQRASFLPVCLRPWEILLLDEPERHLDPDAEALIGDLVRSCVSPTRVCVVATHSPAMVNLLQAEEFWL